MAGVGVTFSPFCNISLPSFPQRASFKTSSTRLFDQYSSNCWKRRGAAVVVGAGPGANSYLFAFVLPLSLLAVTTFASIRIADKLDEDFLQELAINESLKEGDEEDEDQNPEEQRPSVMQRTRNRPKREA